MSKITTIEELKKHRYLDVELPGWEVKDTFKCKLKRVDMIDLITKGKIPNPLIDSVIKIFQHTYQDPKEHDMESLKNMNDLLELFAKIVMVEPTFDEVEEAIGLTYEQKLSLYLFAIGGPKAIEPFLQKPGNTEPDRNGKSL